MLNYDHPSISPPEYNLTSVPYELGMCVCLLYHQMPATYKLGPTTTEVNNLDSSFFTAPFVPREVLKGADTTFKELGLYVHAF